MRFFDFVLLIGGLSRKLLNAHLVLTNLLIFLVNLLLEDASNFCFFLVVLLDLLTGDAGIAKKLLQTVGALLESDVVRGDFVSHFLLVRVVVRLLHFLHHTPNLN